MGTARPRDLLIGRSHTHRSGESSKEQQPVLVFKGYTRLHWAFDFWPPWNRDASLGAVIVL